MAKREIPLFIFDTSRRHNIGDCDFVSCTDVDNGFVARIDFVGADTVAEDEYMRIGRENNGVRLRIKIMRMVGRNPDVTAVRSLLKKAESLYTERMQRGMDSTEPSVEDMVFFLDTLIRGNRHNIAEAGVDQKERLVVESSLRMLESIKRRLNGVEQ